MKDVRQPKYILQFIVEEPLVESNTLEAAKWLGRSTGAWPVCYEKTNEHYVLGFPIRKKRGDYARKTIHERIFEIFGVPKKTNILNLDENGNLLEEK